jgi:hypothetical protein
MAVRNRRLGDIAGFEELVFIVSILSFFARFAVNLRSKII